MLLTNAQIITMHILNIAGYIFTSLSDLEELRDGLLEQCHPLKGTILLSPEGINLSLAGGITEIRAFQNYLKSMPSFSEMTFRESYSDIIPFKRLKVKIKKEIITFRSEDIHPEKERGQSILPETLKKWLDEKREFTLLDTRNDYEVRFGTFKNATHLKINDFCEFKEAAKAIPQDKPVVMFCTGGIRCEKASLQLLKTGFQEVYQLEGGILNYFAETKGAHYQGDCFVFDERVALNKDLLTTGSRQCLTCHGPIAMSDTLCPTCL